MATYTLNELRHKWTTGELTVEHLLILEEELNEVKQRLRQLEQPPAAGKPQS